ncbi:hypothetical protein TeGR_g11294 [Tetraparma gracilis]|uniref:Leucine-rich repeat domain-containing protein n=1 Tax=Tetraparma gracilis TaxID=2962635 RepID=A0ABQ6MTS8_9STRA|nr:hypothetical protein TeGR_g11294 [Tetraparma gracilis]
MYYHTQLSDTTVSYSGQCYEFDNFRSENDDVVGFDLEPGVTAIRIASFRATRVSSLEALRGSEVAQIREHAFEDSDVESLEALPGCMSTVSHKAFAGCSSLQSLAGLPFPCRVSSTAFDSCFRLHQAAAFLGFTCVHEWVRARALRFAVLAAVRRCQDAPAGDGGCYAPLLAGITRLPEDVVRAVLIPLLS